MKSATYIRPDGQMIHDMAGQRTLAHVGHRFVVDDVIIVAGAQQFQEKSRRLLKPMAPNQAKSWCPTWVQSPTVLDFMFSLCSYRFHHFHK